MRSLYHIPTIVTLSMLSFAAHAEESVLKAQQQGNIAYITGGIGSTEANALAAVKQNYNVYITSADVAGQYTGDFRVLITNVKHEQILDAQGGPMIYAHLPEGHYRIIAYYGDQTKEHDLILAKNKTKRVHFSWK